MTRANSTRLWPRCPPAATRGALPSRRMAPHGDTARAQTRGADGQALPLDPVVRRDERREDDGAGEAGVAPVALRLVRWTLSRLMTVHIAGVGAGRWRWRGPGSVLAWASQPWSAASASGGPAWGSARPCRGGRGAWRRDAAGTPSMFPLRIGNADEALTGIGLPVSTPMIGVMRLNPQSSSTSAGAPIPSRRGSPARGGRHEGAVDVRCLGRDEPRVLGLDGEVVREAPGGRVHRRVVGRLASRLVERDPAQEHPPEVEPEEDHQQRHGNGQRELGQALSEAGPFALSPPFGGAPVARHMGLWEGMLTIDLEVFAGDLSRHLAIGSGPQQPFVLPRRPIGDR